MQINHLRLLMSNPGVRVIVSSANSSGAPVSSVWESGLRRSRPSSLNANEQLTEVLPLRLQRLRVWRA